MAQNFLYMFEFVVDDLLISRPNYCAPEEYPTCCEISFRSSVFVSICHKEFGQCVDMCGPKCGKCCLFSLESPVTDKDRLLVHVYKKKTDKCKFLLGATDLPIKPLFDKVTESFNIENPKWSEALDRHTSAMPDPKNKSPDASKTTVVDNDCDEDTIGRKEQLCPTSELTKRLLPLFNMKGCQTGNVVLIMRLVCNGPTIVSTFPFSKVCPVGSEPKPGKKSCGSSALSKSNTNNNANNSNNNNGNRNASCNGGCPPMPDPCKKEKRNTACRRYFACNADKGYPCEEVEDEFDRGLECPPPNNCEKRKKPKCCSGNNGRSSSPARCNGGGCGNNGGGCGNSGGGCGNSGGRCGSPCTQVDPCKKGEAKIDLCQRYFSNNPSERGCAIEECMDECEAEDYEDDCEEDSCESMQPCFICPTQPDPGPEAYEEFEACLNGSGLTIRVLKNTHQVETVTDGTELPNFEDEDECGKCPKQKNMDSNNDCESLGDILQRSTFARNHIKRRTTGHIVNNPQIPKIRANIKYAANDTCCPEKYYVPFTKLKQFCDNQNNIVDLYRKKKPDDCCGPIVPPRHPDDTRSCCLQVDPQDIKSTLKGINMDARKKGIEVCYKTCNDTDSDVFLVKLGSKKPSQNKRNSIEIELKTPKQPLNIPIQKVTTETQIKEAELDAALSGVCGKKKKGKKGKKK